MNILGIESSCDETAASVVTDGRIIRSNVIVSQIDIHSKYGGVVPEVAARSHIEAINPVIDQALTDAGMGWDDIDAIAVTYAPGLIGSLLIGTLAARTLAVLKNKPLYPVHHVEAHVYANLLAEDRIKIIDYGIKTTEKSQPADAINNTGHNSRDGNLAANEINSIIYNPDSVFFPALALVASGGHSQIMLFHGHNDYEILGQTADDAVGEAFDKVAKIIGLPYPGGPSIAAAALQGDPNAYKLPKAKMAGKYSFSFSGLKTAVLRAIQNEVAVDIAFPSTGLAGLLNASQRNNFAASFQRVAIETLVDKMELAYNEYSPKSVIVAGGVAANAELRRMLSERLPIEIHYPAPELCTDNAAMVASLGYFQSQIKPPVDPLDVEVVPSLSM